MKNILVISHRRSGTHLTVDSLINNFAVFAGSKDIKNSTLDSIFNNDSQVDVKRFVRRYQEGGRVVKTHSTSDYWNHFSRYHDYSRIIDEIFDCPHKVYVYRGGLDVMVSLYRYQREFSDRIKNMRFCEFLRQSVAIITESGERVISKPAYWALHLGGWVFRDDILLLKFDNLKNDFYRTMSELADLLAEPVPARVKNVGMEKSRDGALLTAASGGVSRTSVSFYAGRVGDYKEVFSNSDVSYFKAEVASVSRELLRFCE